MQLHRLLLALLLLAHCRGFSRALPPAANQPGVELPLAWPRPRLDLNPSPSPEDATLERRRVVESSNLVPGEVPGLPDQVVSAWTEQVLELDELTRCIRERGNAIESGNAIERWLDCLASLEEAPEPAVALPPSLATPQSPASPDLFSNDGEVNDLHLPADHAKMVTFDPLSVSSTGSQTSGTLDEHSDVVQSSMKDTGYGMAPHHILDQSQNSEPAASLEDEGSEAEAGASSGGGGDRESTAHFRRPGDSTVLEMTEHQMPLEDNRLFDEEGTTGGAQKFRRSSSKWGTDISSVAADSRSLENSHCDEDGGCPEMPTEALSSSKRTLNLLDALKLAACLGAAVTLMWRKRGRLRPREEGQAVLSEGAVDYPCPSATGFSMTAGSSSNTDIGHPTVRAGSLSTPLGMAIATVMAEALQQEHGEGAPRTADELTKLLEAAMTESLSPVMGSECPGFVEQFKQSFRSTYRLLGSVRNASGRNPAPLSFSNRSGRFTQRRSEDPGRRYHTRTDDDEDDLSGLRSSSRAAYLDPIFESDSTLQRRVDPVAESDLAAQLSRLTFSANRPGGVAHSRHGGTAALRNAKGGIRDVDSSSRVDHDTFGDLDDVSSPSRRDTSEGLSENCSGEGGSHVHQGGVKSRWGRGGLEQLANVGGAQGVVSSPPSEQGVSQQGGISSEYGELDLALQPFGVTPPGQLVAASESSLSHHGRDHQSHYKQQKIVLMQQEMHLRKMELAYKFHDLHLKEANLEVSSESNSLMRETVDLSRNRAEFKEAEFLDRKLTAAYTELAKRCADEMVAGLCVMLCALFFGAWKFSYGRLVDVVSVCQPTLYEPSNSYVPGFNKIVNSLNHMISQLHMFLCEVTVASRMFLGLGIISVVAASLLRKSVTSNSHAMPATILIVVLGGICGFAGKFAVESMGGSGYHWLLLWEIFCLVHTAATCFTSTLFRILNGVPPSATGKSHRQPYFMGPWWRRVWFHCIVVLVLPILAGLLPFAHVREIVEVLSSNVWDLAYSPVKSYLRKNYHFSLV